MDEDNDGQWVGKRQDLSEFSLKLQVSWTTPVPVLVLVQPGTAAGLVWCHMPHATGQRQRRGASDLRNQAMTAVER